MTAHPVAPLLEREAAIAALEAAFARACEGQGGFVVVGGEAGSGKSRLVDAWRERLPAGTAVLRGRAFPATATTPYAVWIEALDGPLRALRRRDLLATLGDAPDLARFFPGLLDEGTRPPAAPPGESGFEPARFFGQVIAVLTRRARVAPLVLVLDNLQWADESSLALLHAAVRALVGHRALVVALLREESAGAAADCVASLDREGLVQRIAVPPLSVEGVALLARAATDAPWPEERVRRLHELTRGNAFFAWECAKQAVGRQEITWLEGAEALPRSVEAVVAERLRGLHDDARRVLAAAAVIEARSPYALLRAVTGIPEARLLAALDELTAQHLLEEAVEGREVSYGFHKPLVQASVYRTLGAARRQYLHRLVAGEMMQSMPQEASGIARHLVASAAPGRGAQAYPYLLRAGREAAAAFGNHEAVSLLAQARDLAAAAKADPASLYDLHLDLGESQKRLGRFDAAIATWRSALARGDAGRRATLHRCIARAAWQAGRDAEAFAALREGLADPGCAEAGTEGGMLRQEYALALARQGALAEAVREARHVVAATDERQQPELAARAHVVLCMAHGYRGDLRGAFQAGDRAIALAEPLPYPGAAFLAHYTLAALLRYDGDLERFERHAGQCDAIAARMHANALESWAPSVRVERLAFAGRLAEAVAEGERSVAIDRAIGQETILVRTLAFLAVARRMQGDIATARAHLAEASAVLGRFHSAGMRAWVVVRGAGAFLDAAEGREARALEELEAILPRLLEAEKLAFYALHPHLAPFAAELAARLGRIDDARRWIAVLRDLQQPGFRPAEAAILHAEGWLAMHEGDATRAATLLGRAADLHERSPRPWHAARARVDRAEAWLKAGRTPEAVEDLVRAEGLHERIGAARELEAVGVKLRRLGHRPASARAVSAVSPRERDVMRLVALGRKNREIAAELFISELTVETHVKNILRKLGLRSRAQIAAHSAREGALAEVIPISKGSSMSR